MAKRKHGLRFEDYRALVCAVVEAGLKAYEFVASTWILETEAVRECVMQAKAKIISSPLHLVDQSRERVNAARELIRLAASRIGDYASAALALIGGTTDTRNADLKRRRRIATQELNKRSTRYFRETYEPRIIEQIADSLYELVTRPHQLAAALQISNA